MKTMKWLIKREMWEHKGMLVWTPLVVAAALALLAASALFAGRNLMIGGEAHISDVNLVVDGHPLVALGQGLAMGYMASAVPVLLLMGFLVFFYCLGALNDERRDRSLLFWKSLPVSDQLTVLSKVVLALVVTPLIVVAIGIVLALVIVLMAGLTLLAHGTNVFGVMLSSPDFYLTPLRLVGLLPVYLLWALPAVGWLLMVSSWARSKVFLWAVGAPLLTGFLLIWTERIFALGNSSVWFMSNIVSRLLLSVAPGSWFLFEHAERLQTLGEGAQHVNPSNMFQASWATLAGVDVWVGAAAGVAMIAVAIWLRRRREEG